jgi:N-acetylglucosamine-6-phosphate deacetylase
MEQAVNNVMRYAELSLATALKMAGENGEKIFPEVKKDIRVGSPADLVLFECQGEVQIKSTWIRGEKIYG